MLNSQIFHDLEDDFRHFRAFKRLAARIKSYIILTDAEWQEIEDKDPMQAWAMKRNAGMLVDDVRYEAIRKEQPDYEIRGFWEGVFFLTKRAEA